MRYVPVLYKRIQSRLHDNLEAKLRLQMMKKALGVEKKQMEEELESLKAAVDGKAHGQNAY